MSMTKYMSIITLNVSGFNASIKRHRVSEWIRKHNSHICCLQETPQNKIFTQAESEGIEKNIPCKRT